MFTVSKLNRTLHDAYSSACSSLARPALALDATPFAAERWQVQSEGESGFGADAQGPFFSEVVESKVPASDLYRFENVHVTGSQGHIFVNRRGFLDICVNFTGIEDKKIRRPIPPLARQIVDAPVFHLMGRGLGNRGHFLVDHLPRVLACKDIIKDRDCKVLVPFSQKRWAEGYLARIGIASDAIIEGSLGTLFCKQLYYCPLLGFPSFAGLAHARFYKELRERFLSSVSHGAIRHVFLSRKDASQRCLMNEDTVFKHFRQHYPALESIMLSKLDLQEQLDLFANAKIIIGSHSQSFRNLLFTTDAQCIQLVCGRDKPDNVYKRWADVYALLGNLGANRSQVICSETELTEEGNFTFPVECLEAHDLKP